MLVDYYKVLEVTFPSSEAEIKSAYRKQAKKWHPDINPSQEAHSRMIFIHEAYLILSDIEAKARYDHEYLRFMKAQEPKQNSQFTNKREENSNGKSDTENFEYSFEPHDELLKKWMVNAKNQAKDFVKKSFVEAMGMTKVAIKEGAKKTGQMFIGQIIIGVIAMIIFALSRGCN